MCNKINIFAEEEALVRLGTNSEFINGRLMKYILKNQANIFLIMNEDRFNEVWSDSESQLRKFCEAFDLAQPRCLSGLTQIYSKPDLCYQLDPFAIWLFNRSDSDINKFREYFGVWALNPSKLTDNFFHLSHSKEYDRGDEITGSHDNGWGNFLEQVPTTIPPLNSIVLNDRHLLFNTNEDTAEKKGFFGLNNLKILLNEILPHNLKIPFHLLIYCQHPNLSIKTTDTIVKDFIKDVSALRNYKIVIEFVYAVARHKRAFYSNYFLFEADRGFNAFNNYKRKRLIGENDFSIMGYLSDPETTGDTKYQIARSKLSKIKSECYKVYMKPTEENGKIARVQSDCSDFFYNRLFSKPVQTN